MAPLLPWIPRGVGNMGLKMGGGVQGGEFGGGRSGRGAEKSQPLEPVVGLNLVHLYMFILGLSNCLMETCMLLAWVRVHEHWLPQYKS